MTNDQSVDPASVSWEHNNTKRDSDQTVFRAMSYDLHQMTKGHRRRCVRVLSFPGSKWLWEQSLEEAFDRHKFKFVGLERDALVRRRAARQAKLLGDSYSLEPRSDFASFCERHPRGKFDVIYLDWMGTWSREKKADIDAMLTGKCLLEVGGLLLITICLRRGRPETMAELEDQSYDLPMTFYDARGEDKYVSNIKVRGVPHWIVGRAAENGVRLRPIMAHIYYSRCGKGHTQPQLQLMFLREEAQP